MRALANLPTRTAINIAAIMLLALLAWFVFSRTTGAPVTNAPTLTAQDLTVEESDYISALSPQYDALRDSIRSFRQDFARPSFSNSVWQESVKTQLTAMQTAGTHLQTLKNPGRLAPEDTDYQAAATHAIAAAKYGLDALNGNTDEFTQSINETDAANDYLDRGDLLLGQLIPH